MCTSFRRPSFFFNTKGENDGTVFALNLFENYKAINSITDLEICKEGGQET